MATIVSRATFKVLELPLRELIGRDTIDYNGNNTGSALFELSRLTPWSSEWVRQLKLCIAERGSMMNPTLVTMDMDIPAPMKSYYDAKFFTNGRVEWGHFVPLPHTFFEEFQQSALTQPDFGLREIESSDRNFVNATESAESRGSKSKTAAVNFLDTKVWIGSVKTLENSASYVESDLLTILERNENASAHESFESMATIETIEDRDAVDDRNSIQFREIIADREPVEVQETIQVRNHIETWEPMQVGKTIQVGESIELLEAIETQGTSWETLLEPNDTTVPEDGTLTWNSSKTSCTFILGFDSNLWKENRRRRTSAASWKRMTAEVGSDSTLSRCRAYPEYPLAQAMATMDELEDRVEFEFSGQTKPFPEQQQLPNSSGIYVTPVMKNGQSVLEVAESVLAHGPVVTKSVLTHGLGVSKSVSARGSIAESGLAHVAESVPPRPEGAESVPKKKESSVMSSARLPESKQSSSRLARSKPSRFTRAPLRKSSGTSYRNNWETEKLRRKQVAADEEKRKKQRELKFPKPPPALPNKAEEGYLDLHKKLVELGVKPAHLERKDSICVEKIEPTTKYGHVKISVPSHVVRKPKNKDDSVVEVSEVDYVTYEARVSSDSDSLDKFFDFQSQGGDVVNGGCECDRPGTSKNSYVRDGRFSNR